jgi:hypothetical protein
VPSVLASLASGATAINTSDSPEQRASKLASRQNLIIAELQAENRELKESVSGMQSTCHTVVTGAGGRSQGAACERSESTSGSSAGRPSLWPAWQSMLCCARAATGGRHHCLATRAVLARCN